MDVQRSALKWAYAFAVALSCGALLWARQAGAQTPRPSPTPAPLVVHGQFLALANGYLVFTTGDAVVVEPGLHVPPYVRLGIEIRATLDRISHRVVALETGRTAPGDVEIDKLPHEYVVVDPKSARVTASATTAATITPAASATITIDVRVPGSTPVSDDVYLSTDRSAFAPAEVKMLRVDASHWTAQLHLPNGSSLRYEFTRGSFATLERTRTGAIVTAREIVVTNGERTDDTVESWADSQ